MAKYTKDEINEIFTRWQKANPSPKSDLNYNNPYTLLVAVVLSAQATDKGVNKATEKLFEVADDPYKMVELGEERLIEYIKSIGLYRNKAKNVINLSQSLIDKHGGKVPDNGKELEALAGVGHKTANVVLNIIFNKPTIAVDTHIFRLSNRMGLAPGKNVNQVENQLLKVVPDEFIMHAHHWLILHGRYICKARKPDCSNCIINDICKYGGKLG